MGWPERVDVRGIVVGIEPARGAATLWIIDLTDGRSPKKTKTGAAQFAGQAKPQAKCDQRLSRQTVARAQIRSPPPPMACKSFIYRDGGVAPEVLAHRGSEQARGRLALEEPSADGFPFARQLLR